MRAIEINSTSFHCADSGDPEGPALVFANSLGTDFRIWDGVLSRLDPRVRVFRYDKRGHGLSDCPPGPWRIDDLVGDLASLLDHVGIADAVICGLSVGGVIAQGLAAKRPDLTKALILCDTGAKVGDHDTWNQRIAAVEGQGEGQGIASIADAVMQRWFSDGYLREAADLPIWRNMLTRTPAAGYAGVCRVLRDTDLRESTAALRLPCLAMVGDEDGATPPDLVRETAALIPGSRFELISPAGHLPCIEQPETVAQLINEFLREIGHV